LKPYSQDIRVRVIQSYENGEGSQRQLARRYNVSLSFVQQLLKRYRETGDIVPQKQVKPVKPKVDETSLRLILEMIDRDPNLPLSRLCEQLAMERQLLVSRATMWRTIRKHRPYRASLKMHPRRSSSLTNLYPLSNMDHVD
jgi:transposase